ncbi:TFIIB-type zinc ribbon-containing protein [Candidatus Nitrosotenuis chungbukensis]|uniref:transcription initiation factor IIB n=1 Tax=Candidatus Nitrosotenuis chungbukensis TaxID=1353246 RepID=UPI002672E58F|nr:TFIIB-type zinc ribbon-containing protein [Candidatus Nitrosotenuis chungbukensis]WKT57662.1 TFIIB-type zinc ribbon-containing protein [Candidatus Nitrosotenuis chungbukensis]
MSSSSQIRCPSCAKNAMQTDVTTGEMFCRNCGYVVAEKIEESGPEWRAFSNDESDRSRVGAGTSLTMHDMGLSTVIGSADKDATGKPLSASMKSPIERLRTWDSRTQTHSSADRNLRQALSELDKMKDKMALAESVVEKAAYIYRKAMEKKLVRGRSIHGLIAACLYAACRNTETPRTLDDVAESINIRRKDAARCYRLIYKELDLKMPVADPTKGISRIASTANLSEKTKRRAMEILNKAKKIGMVAGKDPMGIAAAALYLACISNGEIRSQKDISIAAGVTEVTIRNRCVGLKTLLD